MSYNRGNTNNNSKRSSGANKNNNNQTQYQPPDPLYNFEDYSLKNIERLPSNFYGDSSNAVSNKYHAAAAFLNYFEKEVTIRDRSSGQFVKRKANIYRDQIRYLEQREIKLLDIDYQDFADWISTYYHKMSDICEKHGFSSPFMDTEQMDAHEKNDLCIFMYCKYLLNCLEGEEAEEFQHVMKKGALLVFKAVVDLDFWVEDIPDFKVGGINQDQNEEESYEETNPDPKRTNRLNETHIGVTNYPIERDIFDIHKEMLNHVVMIRGDLDSFDDHSRLEVLTSQWQCDYCGFRLGMYGDSPPSKCPNAECGNKNCFKDLNRYTTNEYVYMKVSQNINTDDTLIGTSDIVVKVEGVHLISHFNKKTRQSNTLKVTGIVKLAKEKLNKNNPKEHVFQLQALSIEVEGESTSVQYNEKLLDIIANGVSPAHIDEHYDKLKRSICPHLYKLEPVKEAVLLMLVGAVARVDPFTKRRIRGDMVLLLAGDPSLGKSEFGTFIPKVNPYSIRTVGGSKTTTAAALTSSWEIIKDVKVISKGVLPRCDMKGIAIIDELDKRDAIDMQVLAIPLDDNQVIPTHKSNYHNDIPARCPVLLIGNASKNNGRWDKSKDINSQTNYGQWLISRSDLIFILTDDNDMERKAKQVEHMAKSRSGMMSEEDFKKNQKHRMLSEIQIDKIERDFKANKFEGHYDTEYLRHEFYYLKNTYKPTIKPGSDVEALLKKEYLKFSQIPMIQTEDEETGAINTQNVMDSRAYNGLERIAMSVARAHRHHTVTLKDMEIAINLMFSSLMTMMLEPKADSDKLKEGSKSVYKQLQRMMNDPDAISGFVKASDMQERQDEQKAFKKFTNAFRTMNVILIRLGLRTCPDCRGRQKISVESASGITSETCVTCEGKGQMKKEECFTRNDLEMEMQRQKIGGFGKEERDEMIEVYRNNKDIINAEPGRTVKWTVSDRFMDSAYLADIAQSMAMIFAKREAQEEKVKRQIRLSQPK